ncbi:MAG: hypothetical protein JWM68_3243 [Verrucomicrobiales bacterium]|nr:hypothetical protein [Verrucomicrobiales bacterium]
MSNWRFAMWSDDFKIQMLIWAVFRKKSAVTSRTPRAEIRCRSMKLLEQFIWGLLCLSATIFFWWVAFYFYDRHPHDSYTRAFEVLFYIAPLVAVVLVELLTSGAMACRVNLVKRTEEPREYWKIVIFHGILLLVILAVAWFKWSIHSNYA